jgi:hypothetical protein
VNVGIVRTVAPFTAATPGKSRGRIATTFVATLAILCAGATLSLAIWKRRIPRSVNKVDMLVASAPESRTQATGIPPAGPDDDTARGVVPSGAPLRTSELAPAGSSPPTAEVAAASVAASVPPRSPPATRLSRVAPRVSPSATRTAPAQNPRRETPDCDPNYYLDTQGEKHFKVECFAP